jgi:hypothetical protein
MKIIKRLLLIVIGLILLAYIGVFGFHYYYYSIASSINEPVYVGPKIQYCWLVFGPESKLRILVRRNGNAIAVDADGNGSFGWKEQFASSKDCKDIIIADPDGKTNYRISQVDFIHFDKTPWCNCTFDVEIQGSIVYIQEGTVDMGEQSQRAPEVHFNSGLLSFDNQPDPCLLSKIYNAKGDQNYKYCLNVRLGTNKVYIPGIVNGKRVFSEGVCPVAEIEFPPRNPGDPPIKKQYALDRFC